MFPHLKEEEDIAVPLMRAYFTKEDLRPLIMKLIKKGADYEMGSFIHTFTPEAFRKDFMVQEGIPFFIWYIDFRFQYRCFAKDFVKNIDHLKRGTAPPKSFLQKMVDFFLSCAILEKNVESLRLDLTMRFLSGEE